MRLGEYLKEQERQISDEELDFFFSNIKKECGLEVETQAQT